MIFNANPKTDWRLGQTCFFIQSYSDLVVEARIRDVYNSPDFPAATLSGVSVYGTSDMPLHALFETSEEAHAAQKAHHFSKVQGFEAEMPDVASMVRFAYTHQVGVCEEYTDWAAREAYKNRAKSLMGIDLDTETD